MISPFQLHQAIQTALPVTIGIIGDSTTCGYGANSGPILWTNGQGYLATNPDGAPNWGPAGGAQYIVTSANPPGRVMPETQANFGIPSASRLLETWLKSLNANSVFYNCGGSGWTADFHVTYASVNYLATKTPKPDAVIIALGINSAKGGALQGAGIRTLVNQLIAANILPILSKGHNVAVDGRTGTYYGPGNTYGTPDNWVPMPLWTSIRAELDTISREYSPNLSIIDPGSANNALDITKLYDPFHPSAHGYQAIFNAYQTWLLTGSGVQAGKPVHIMSSRSNVVSSGPIRINTSGSVKNLPVAPGAARIKTSVGIKQIGV